MEKFTGTIGNPSVDATGNKIVKPIGEPIDIVFYAKGKAPIIRKTAADGKYDFTLVNGSYQVSMYLSALPEAFRIRADLRDGEFFVVAENSPTSAFQEWIDTAVDANKPEDNPIVKHIQGQLDAMQVILDQFRDETSFVGDSNGKIMREGAGGWLTNASQKAPQGHSFKTRLPSGAYALYSGLYDKPSWQRSGDAYLTFGWGSTYYIDLVFGTGGKVAISGTRNGIKSQWYDLYTQENTTVDSNGFIKAASPIINLFSNRIEPNNHFSQEYEKEPTFEKLDTGAYKISNTCGLAKGEYVGDWYIETPKDINGERYFNTEYQQLEDNTVIIRTYEREAFTEEYQRYDENGNALTDKDGNILKFYKRHEINGDPVDIKDGRFIALRFVEDEDAKAKREADHKAQMQKRTRRV